MTHTLLVTRPVKPVIEPRRKLFALYRRLHNGRYERISDCSYYEQNAAFVFYDRIHEGFAKGQYLCIRPID